MSLPLFVLNSKNILLSTYKNDRTLILATHDRLCANELKHIMMENYHDNRVWLTKHVDDKKTMNANKLMLTSTNFCDLEDKSGDKTLDITYFDLTDDRDTMFIAQLKDMLNTELFVIENLHYNPTDTLLTLNGVSMWCESINDIVYDTRAYFNDLMQL